ncbi:MAG: F0F1 ATP synthase subunit gamma [Kovacikia sp.]
MANLRAIRDRIKSVNNTQKITKAMRLVAAAKVRRAQEQVLATRPFADKLAAVLYRLQSRLQFEDVDLPLLATREVKTVALLVFSADRGLCGGYNSNILRQAVTRIRELQQEGLAFKIYPVGNKAINFFRRSAFADQVDKTYGNLPQVPTAAESGMLADDLLSIFLSGEIDRVEMVYTKFISLIAARPSLQTLLPLDPKGLSPEDEIFKLTSRDGRFEVSREKVQVQKQEIPQDMIFEQDPAQILDSLLPLYLNNQILRALQEASASELAARMTAMSAASDNAKKLIGTLTIEYNKARQASITQQIMEIVGGAEAMS